MKEAIIIGLILLMSIVVGCSDRGDLNCGITLQNPFKSHCKEYCIRWIERNCNMNITGNCDSLEICSD